MQGTPDTTDGEDFHGRLMSFEEWEALDEDEPGELVDGRLVEEEEVGYLHEVAVAWLTAMLYLWASPRGGYVGSCDARFKVAPRRGRKSDLSVCLSGRRPPPEGLVALPPDIMVEVVSRRPRDVRRDRVEKTNEYAAFGVRYYWILDPQVRSLEILELTDHGIYAHVLGATGGLLSTIPGCDGLTIDLDQLWRMLDQFDAQP